MGLFEKSVILPNIAKLIYDGMIFQLGKSLHSLDKFYHLSMR